MFWVRSKPCRAHWVTSPERALDLDPRAGPISCSVHQVVWVQESTWTGTVVIGMWVVFIYFHVFIGASYGVHTVGARVDVILQFDNHA